MKYKVLIIILILGIIFYSLFAYLDYKSQLAKLEVYKFLKENSYASIEFLYNNSYLIDNRIIAGTRGWNIQDTDSDSKMVKRENITIYGQLQTTPKEEALANEMHQ